jgi:hypothetical protein
MVLPKMEFCARIGKSWGLVSNSEIQPDGFLLAPNARARDRKFVTGRHRGAIRTMTMMHSRQKLEV